ncbi:SOS response-associated peptidase family protein [Roseateles puraquae]|jgi:putative SOS response-associated peptidase YedK|uniref:SOS response-associated peptidase family protein n=1 Tax=Roseateles puraquae TaxID=431059 RepID=UPI0031E38B55
MHPHYVPVTDAALLLARFGAALPEGGSPCPEAPGERDMPLLMPAQTKPAGAVGEVRLGRLGLLSRRAVDLSLGGQATHCAIETMKSLATFRESWWAGQRCVVPVMGLQAWSFSTGQPQRWTVQQSAGLPLALAGLWNTWTGPDGAELLSFCVLTRPADGHEVFRHLASPGQAARMPVLLPLESLAPWLDGALKDAERLLQRPMAEALQAAPLAQADTPWREPASWSVVPDMFAHEWHAMAAQAPATATRRASPRLMRPRSPEPAGPTTADLF